MTTDRSHASFARALRIAAYNRPLYVAAAIVFVLGGLTAYCPGLPVGVRWTAGLAALVAAWYAAASFWAFHAMFDRSELLGGRWLVDVVPKLPRRWVQINAGLEETTLPIQEVFPDADGMSLDLYDPAVMTEPAVAKARQRFQERSGVTAQPDALPLGDGWADLVVVMLAAHEIRDVSLRERFFHELRRIVVDEGHIVVVEHLRDLAAALAFGPGLFHFYPRQEWLRLGESAGLKLVGERRITSFVRVFVFCPLASPHVERPASF